MNPVFILGNPRSGTSLLRLMLTSHPSIIIPPESHFFLWLEDKYGNWRKKDGLDELLNDVFKSTKFETWNLYFDELKKELINNNAYSYSDVIESIYLFYGKKSGKNDILIWGDKNKLWKEKLEVITKYFPNAKFIHIVRDGRDVACSFKELANKKIKSKYAPKLPTDIAKIAERWKVNIIKLSSFLEFSISLQHLTIKYEDLITTPMISLETISSFLEIDFDPIMLKYYEVNKNKDYEPPEFFQWKSKLGNPPDKLNIGKYKYLLTENEINYFNRFCRNELMKFGYL